MRGARLLLLCPLAIIANLVVYHMLWLVGATGLAAVARAMVPWVTFLSAAVPLVAVSIFDFDGNSRRRLVKKRQ